jgi:hypothetical protein
MKICSVQSPSWFAPAAHEVGLDFRVSNLLILCSNISSIVTASKRYFHTGDKIHRCLSDGTMVSLTCPLHVASIYCPQDVLNILPVCSNYFHLNTEPQLFATAILQRAKRVNACASVSRPRILGSYVLSLTPEVKVCSNFLS